MLFSINSIIVKLCNHYFGFKTKCKIFKQSFIGSNYLDEVEVGKTPFEIKLARKSEHSVMIKLEGYQTYQTTLTKKFNAWYIGNIVIGGWIGAIYNLSPNEINAQMNIAVALNIDPNWRKVGQLEKVNN